MAPTFARRSVSVTVAVLLISLTNTAHAQTAKQPSAAQKDTARTLLVDCRNKFGKNDFAGALKSCQGAHAIMGVPTTGLDLAKVQQAMGQLVEARETTREVIRFDNSANNSAFTQAQNEAAQLEKDLDKRIPSLVISVSGAPSTTTVQVVVDSDEVPAAAMSLPFRVNPGKHKVVASADGLGQTERTVMVTEGQSATVNLEFGRKDDSQDKPSPGRNIPIWAWAAGGVGVLGLGASIYFGLQFSETQTIVARDCPNNECKPSYTNSEADELQSQWNRELVLTTVTASVGAIGIGAAIYGIVTAPKKTDTATRFVPWLGRDVAGGSLVGHF